MRRDLLLMQPALTVVGKVLASARRLRVLATIQEGVVSPKMMASKLDMPSSHVSKVLRDLEKLGLVECVTPDLRKGRIFSLTTSGNQVLQRVRSFQGSGGPR